MYRAKNLTILFDSPAMLQIHCARNTFEFLCMVSGLGL